MRDLILFPFNGNSREAVMVVHALNQVEPQWTLLGFIDDDPQKKGLDFHGYPVLGGREELKRHDRALVLAQPGRPGTFIQRPEIIDGLELPRERFATLIDPSASLGPGAKVGINVVLMPNVVITSDTVLGDHVLVLANSVVAHDCTIGAYSMVGSNVTVSGGATVGENCYLGSGCRIIQEVNAGAGSLIGLGSVVIRDVAPGTVVAGNPARPLRDMARPS